MTHTSVVKHLIWGITLNKPIFLPADLYEQVVAFIATDAEACEALGIGTTSPARNDVVVGLGGVLDVWSEKDRATLEIS